MCLNNTPPCAAWETAPGADEAGSLPPREKPCCRRGAATGGGGGLSALCPFWPHSRLGHPLPGRLSILWVGGSPSGWTGASTGGGTRLGHSACWLVLGTKCQERVDPPACPFTQKQPSDLIRGWAVAGSSLCSRGSCLLVVGQSWGSCCPARPSVSRPWSPQSGLFCAHLGPMKWKLWPPGSCRWRQWHGAAGPLSPSVPSQG